MGLENVDLKVRQYVKEYPFATKEEIIQYITVELGVDPVLAQWAVV